MKNQALLSSKDKSKKLKCRLLQFLFGAKSKKLKCRLLQFLFGAFRVNHSEDPVSSGNKFRFLISG